MNHNLLNTEKAHKIEFERTYYYGISDEVKFYENKDIKADSFERFNSDIVTHRNSICLIQNDDFFMNENFANDLQSRKKRHKGKKI